MANLLGSDYFPYYSEAIAELVASQLFHVQVFCGIIALLHLLAVRFYFGIPARQLWLGLLLSVLAVSLLTGAWLQPKINVLHLRRNASNLQPQQRESVAHEFNAWQNVMFLANLCVVAGLAVYLWRVANPPDPARFVSTAKFRG
jgi:phosphoglycerol transferase MdoB-like AlkP superfamily enzyme